MTETGSVSERVKVSVTLVAVWPTEYTGALKLMSRPTDGGTTLICRLPVSTPQGRVAVRVTGPSTAGTT